MNNKQHAKNLLDTMPIVNRSASIMNAGARSRFNSPTQMGHSPAEMGHSPAEMGHSPLEAKNFPVKPGMKLSNFEELIDKRTGERVGKEALNVAEGTDLSHLEGVTNLSQLATGGLRSEANISNRVNVSSNQGNTTYPKVNLNVDRGLEFENGEPSSFDLGENYQTKDKRVNRVKGEIKDMLKSHNVRSSARGDEGSYENVGFTGGRPGILETDANQPRSASNEDIYTTARLTDKSDMTRRGTTYSMHGATGDRSISRPFRSNLTQQNTNMPESFTLSRLQSVVEKQPGRYYSPAQPGKRLYDRKTGNIPSLSNIKDNYQHLDFTGDLQRPNDQLARIKEQAAKRQNPDLRTSQFRERDSQNVRTYSDFNEPSR